MKMRQLRFPDMKTVSFTEYFPAGSLLLSVKNLNLFCITNNETVLQIEALQPSSTDCSLTSKLFYFFFSFLFGAPFKKTMQTSMNIQEL